MNYNENVEESIPSVLDNEHADTMEERDERPELVDFDEVLNRIGMSFRYQVLQSVIIMSFLVPYGWSILNFALIGYEPPHVCSRTNNTELLSKYSLLNDTTAQVVYEMCQIRITSNATGSPEDVALTGCIDGFAFEGGNDAISLKTEWGLVCEKRGVAELVQTILNLGMSVGALTVNPLSDRIGRKRVLLACGTATFLFEFGIVFSPTIYVVIALKMLSGIFVTNLGVVPNVFGQEMFTTKKRQVFAIALVFCWTCGLLLLGAVAYALRDYSWRTLQLVSALHAILPLLLLYFVDESLPWLFAEGKHAQALKIIKRACEKNGTDFAATEEAYNECILRAKKSKATRNDAAVAKYGVMDFVRHRRLLVTTLVLLLCYFSHSTTYFGLYLTSSIFYINRHFMFMILAGTEIPTSVLCFILIHHIGRRKIVIMFLSMTGLCLLISALLVSLGSPSSEHVGNASAAFFILGKFAINVSYTCLYAFTLEFFPTTLRSIGFGMCAFFSRVGGMVAPFLFLLYGLANWAPGPLLTALCLITVALYPLVPETKDKELPTTIEACVVLEKTSHNVRKREKQGYDTGVVELECYENLQQFLGSSIGN